MTLLDEFEELRIFFVDAHHLVGLPHLRFGKAPRREFPAQPRHAPEERHAVRAAAVAAKARQQQPRDFGRDAVFEALGFFVCARPLHAEHLDEQFFSEAMAKHQVMRGSPALGGKFDAPAAAYMKVAAAGHALERSGDGRRRDAEILGETRADWRLLFLHDLPYGFQVVFLGDAGGFTAHFSEPELLPAHCGRHFPLYASGIASSLTQVQAGEKTLDASFASSTR